MHLWTLCWPSLDFHKIDKKHKGQTFISSKEVALIQFCICAEIWQILEFKAELQKEVFNAKFLRTADRGDLKVCGMEILRMDFCDWNEWFEVFLRVLLAKWPDI